MYKMCGADLSGVKTPLASLLSIISSLSLLFPLVALQSPSFVYCLINSQAVKGQSEEQGGVALVYAPHVGITVCERLPYVPNNDVLQPLISS